MPCNWMEAMKTPLLLAERRESERAQQRHSTTRCGQLQLHRVIVQVHMLTLVLCLLACLQEISEKARELVRLAICTEGGRKTLKREDINKKGAVDSCIYKIEYR